MDSTFKSTKIGNLTNTRYLLGGVSNSSVSSMIDLAVIK